MEKAFILNVYDEGENVFNKVSKSKERLYNALKTWFVDKEWAKADEVEEFFYECIEIPLKDNNFISLDCDLDIEIIETEIV